MKGVTNVKKEYAVYKGEDHIAFGTLEELAKKLDVQPRTIYFYSTAVYKRRWISCMKRLASGWILQTKKRKS